MISIGLSLIQAAAIASFTDEAEVPVENTNGNAVVVILFSTVLTQLLAIIFGTINVTGEYSTGMIRSTLTAAPDRLRSLFAKVLVLSTSMFVFSIIVFAVAGLVTRPILPTGGVDFSHLDSSLWPLLAAALYMALIGRPRLSASATSSETVRERWPSASASSSLRRCSVMFFPAERDLPVGARLLGLPALERRPVAVHGCGVSGARPSEMVPGLIAMIAWPLAAVIGGCAVLKSRDA